MTEEVLVSVCGVHSAEETGQDEIEVISAGKYYFRNNKHYIMYEESVEDTSEMVQSCIKLQDGKMEVKKKGPLRSEMLFERGKKNASLYHTPFGTMTAAVDVSSFEFRESEDLIEAQVEYSLEMNFEHVADCSIRVKVMSKNSSHFHLS